MKKILLLSALCASTMFAADQKPQKDRSQSPTPEEICVAIAQLTTQDSTIAAMLKGRPTSVAQHPQAQQAPTNTQNQTPTETKPQDDAVAVMNDVDDFGYHPFPVQTPAVNAYTADGVGWGRTIPQGPQLPAKRPQSAPAKQPMEESKKSGGQ